MTADIKKVVNDLVQPVVDSMKTNEPEQALQMWKAWASLNLSILLDFVNQDDESVVDIKEPPLLEFVQEAFNRRD